MDMVKRDYLLPAIVFFTIVNAYAQPDTSWILFDSINPRIGSQIRVPTLSALGCNSFRDEKVIYQETADFINKYPLVLFQLESHTDCRASAEYNRDLSQRRADSARKYILSGLTDTSQLPLAVGMGEADLLIKKCSCDLSDHKNLCTEWEHQQNRRTILRVIGFKNPVNKFQNHIDETQRLHYQMDTANAKVGEFIYYHQQTCRDKPTIRPDDAILMDFFVRIIKKYPLYKFSIEDHTSCWGDSLYNRIYTQRWSDSLRAYILSRGVDSSQIIAIGMGEDDLIIKKCKCGESDYYNICTTWEHEQNRRIVLRIIWKLED